MPRTCLVIDTTSNWIVVGLFGAGPAQSVSLPAAREASSRLAPMIRRLVADGGQRPDWIACAVGPGSFTGIRIGVGTARNLGQLWDVPVLALDSLGFYSFDCRKKKVPTSAQPS